MVGLAIHLHHGAVSGGSCLETVNEMRSFFEKWSRALNEYFATIFSPPSSLSLYATISKSQACHSWSVSARQKSASPALHFWIHPL